MTGFGRSKIETDEFAVMVEIKSVNHRFREFYFRVPRQLLKIEEKIKKVINEYVSRGRIEVFITIDGEGFLNRNVQVDWDLVDRFYEILHKIKQRYELNDQVTLNHFLAQTELIQIEENDVENESLNKVILQAVQEATEQLKEMRVREGTLLKDDIISYMVALRNHITKLTEYSPIVAQQYEDHLRKKVAELLEEQIDEARLLSEVTIYADKSDISEELTRLRSHHLQFLDTIELQEQKGRKLDFILQEMNREVNTIGAKCNDAQIGKEVVEMKSLLEKIKEQVQNIE